MPRNKLKRFAELEQMPNAFFCPSEMKGKWHEYFGNKNPIVLELGCGAGDYSRQLSERFPDKNFIGIDKKGDRLWRGAVAAAGQKNVAFVRCYVEKLAEYFGPGEVSEIWITFPEPFPKPSKSQRRMTSERLLAVYSSIMKNGLIHLKTDDQDFYDFSLETAREHAGKILRETRDLYGGGEDGSDGDLNSEILRGIQTFYEKKWLNEGKSICYLEYKL